MHDGSDLRHLGVDPSRLCVLASQHGTVADHVPSASRFSGAVNDTLFEQMQRVASEVLTDQQLRVWVLWLAGRSVVEIADALALSHQRIGHILNGRPEKWEPGVVSKMKAALQKDEAFMAAAAEALEEKAEQQRALEVWWLASINRPEMFVPLTVLLLAARVSDEKQRVRFDYLVTLMPRIAVETALHHLRARGYIMFDGVTVEVRRTPLDKEA